MLYLLGLPSRDHSAPHPEKASLHTRTRFSSLRCELCTTAVAAPHSAALGLRESITVPYRMVWGGRTRGPSGYRGYLSVTHAMKLREQTIGTLCAAARKGRAGLVREGGWGDMHVRWFVCKVSVLGMGGEGPSMSTAQHRGGGVLEQVEKD